MCVPSSEGSSSTATGSLLGVTTGKLAINSVTDTVGQKFGSADATSPILCQIGAKHCLAASNIVWESQTLFFRFKQCLKPGNIVWSPQTMFETGKHCLKPSNNV